MVYASIDIGTNTVLLLVARCRDGMIDVIHEEQRIPRLGRGVDRSGNLHSDSMSRVLDALGEYRKLLQLRYPEVADEDVAVTATSAVRDAANRETFILRVEQETGFEVLLLDGEEEAAYTFIGALSVLPEIGRAAVIDIGGGSTEIAYGEGTELLDRYSYDMGSVRFTERYLTHDPPVRHEIETCSDAVRHMLAKRTFGFAENDQKIRLVGVAGTVTSIAYMELGLDSYDPEPLNGTVLGIETVESWIRSLSKLKAAEMEEAYPAVMKGRADVITAGLVILHEFMDYYSIPELTVSTGGIRHGAILKMAAAKY